MRDLKRGTPLLKTSSKKYPFNNNNNSNNNSCLFNINSDKSSFFLPSGNSLSRVPKH